MQIGIVRGYPVADFGAMASREKRPREAVTEAVREVLGEGWDLLCGKGDIAGPSTAGGASLALKNGFHDREWAIPGLGCHAAPTARSAFHGWK